MPRDRAARQGSTSTTSARRRIGTHKFGASAPLEELQKKFGLTSDAVVAAA